MKDKLELNKEEYDIFPDDFDINIKVLEYYQDLVFEQKQNELNTRQKHFTLYYIVDAMINNSGIYSILLESLGEYNEGYLEMLKMSENLADYEDFKIIIKIFNDYKESFLEQEYPEQLDEDSDNFDSDISELIEKIEHNWYENSEIREEKFFKYLRNNKSEIIRS
ncbi:DUF4375 domain-containing protein [Flavobacterium sp. GP15]|uniref:DMP19 family protein n=1 Tax=Flavobacterium sp. GP15 TaxID=2758567 RepID=UPI00165EB598|nr:DUF4375 domain-containing protein [Flavobacterium sp. GP15]